MSAIQSKVPVSINHNLSTTHHFFTTVIIFGRPFVKRFALCYRTVVLSCLSVTLVYSDQTVGRIKMKLGVQVGLGPGHIVLDGDRGPLPQRGRAPNFRYMCIVPKGWMDQYATWYGCRPRLRPHCVRWEPSSPSQKGGTAQTFGPCLLWPNGWMDQDATWYVGRSRPRMRCVTWGPSSPSKKGTAPIFGPCLLWPNGRPFHLLLSSCLLFMVALCNRADHNIFIL